MAMTRVMASRVEPSLETLARGAHPALATIDASRLLRIGLAVLAGHKVPEAIEVTKPAKSGPKPKDSAAA
jgi:hypothetical protein